MKTETQNAFRTASLKSSSFIQLGFLTTLTTHTAKRVDQSCQTSCAPKLAHASKCAGTLNSHTSRGKMWKMRQKFCIAPAFISYSWNKAMCDCSVISSTDGLWKYTFGKKRRRRKKRVK